MTTIRNAEFSKVLAAVAIVGMIALGFSFAVPQAQASSTVDIVCALVNCDAATRAALEAVLGGSSTGSSFTFTRDLTIGSTGQDVMELQKFLNDNGYAVAASGAGSAGSESTYFGSLTQAALAKYQAAKGIAPAVGYFGPITRVSVNAQSAAAGTGSTTGSTTGSSSLSGGAGSVDTYTLVSGYTNEEVGEGQNDVEVAGLEIENSDGSDIEVSALKVVFAEGTAGSRFVKYADEVSVLFNGEVVGSVDGSKFTSDNTYTQTINLDPGVVIDSGETDQLILAISAVDNLDTADATDTWTVDFTSVRYRDASGATISEDPGVGLTTFSFENLATAKNLELKISTGDASINEAHIIGVEATTAKDDVPVFSFKMEVEGDADVEVDAFSVEATVTGAGHLDEMVDNLVLYMDGEKVDSMAPATDEETQLFNGSNGLNLELKAGETYDFEIRADFLAISGALDEGDTLSFALGETETDLATTDIVDENGDALVDADITGSVTSEASATYSVYIDVALVGTPTIDVQEPGAGTADDDVTTFVMVFDITAHGDSVYVGDTAAGTTVADGSVGIPVTDAIVYRVYDSGTATTDATADLVTFTTPAGVTDSTDNILITDGSTSRVTMTVTNTGWAQTTLDTSDGIYYLDLAGIGWGIADDTVYEYVYTYGLDDFETATKSAN